MVSIVCVHCTLYRAGRTRKRSFSSGHLLCIELSIIFLCPAYTFFLHYIRNPPLLNTVYCENLAVINVPIYVCIYFIIIYNGKFSSISYGETWSHRRHSGYTGHHEGGRKQGSILIKQGRTITDIRSHLIDTKNLKNDLSSFVDFTYLLFWKWTPLLPTPLRFCASLVPNSFRHM